MWKHGAGEGGGGPAQSDPAGDGESTKRRDGVSQLFVVKGFVTDGGKSSSQRLVKLKLTVLDHIHA